MIFSLTFYQFLVIMGYDCNKWQFRYITGKLYKKKRFKYVRSLKMLYSRY